MNGGSRAAPEQRISDTTRRLDPRRTATRVRSLRKRVNPALEPPRFAGHQLWVAERVGQQSNALIRGDQPDGEVARVAAADQPELALRPLDRELEQVCTVQGLGALVELPAEEQRNVTAEFEAIRRSAGVLHANQLQAPATAATVRVAGGRTRVTEGPAVTAGNELDGYYVYDASDLDAAIAFAARIPVARLGGTVEVRPILER